MDIVINIEDGKIGGKRALGLNGVGFFSFQGIPYAKPPLGDLRFKAPRLPEQWSGIKDCTKEGPSAYARHTVYFQNVIGSEDCLILNVFTKDIQKNADKPVMVWIHGGGFVNGSSALYGPDFFMTQDVVLVTINYRLGILGFLSFDDPDVGVPGNAGLKDQVMALKWVQRNIEQFGGDPGNVTIFGESAGAASVHYLILSPMAKNLFHKAILQSGCALNPWSIANNCLKKILDNLQCPFTNDKDILRFLQEQTIEELFGAQEKLGDHLGLHILRDFGPIIEKPSQIEPNFITEYPVKVLEKGLYNKVPLIIGYTSAEGMLLQFYQKLMEGIKLEITDFEEAIPNNFNIKFGSDQSKSISAKIKEFYSGNTKPEETDIQKFILMHGDAFFLHGIHHSVKCHLDTSNCPIYLYRFSVEGERNLFKNIIGTQSPGASHVDELAYLFHIGLPEYLNDNKITTNSLEDKTIRRMIGFWTNFAKTGDPNPVVKDDVINVTWKRVTKEDLNFIEIGNNLCIGTSPDADRMQLWNDIYNSVT